MGEIGDMYLRQQDLFAREKAHTPILVVGAGSLGSWAVMGLAKLGFRDIKVYDDDSVELHNIPSQCFSIGDVGERKVEALRRHIKAFADVDIRPEAERFNRQVLTRPIVVVTPDNMATRKQVFMRCVGNTEVRRFVDGRMGGEAYRVYAIDPNNQEQVRFYLKNWYSDEDGETVPCTARGTGYNAAMCAMEIVNVVKRAVMEQECPLEIITDSAGMWREVNWK